MYFNNYKNILGNLKFCRYKKEAKNYLKTKDINLTCIQPHELKDFCRNNVQNTEKLSFEILDNVSGGFLLEHRIVEDRVFISIMPHSFLKEVIEQHNNPLPSDAMHEVVPLNLDVKNSKITFGQIESKKASDFDISALKEIRSEDDLRNKLSEHFTDELTRVIMQNLDKKGYLDAIKEEHMTGDARNIFDSKSATTSPNQDHEFDPVTANSLDQLEREQQRQRSSSLPMCLESKLAQSIRSMHHSQAEQYKYEFLTTTSRIAYGDYLTEQQAEHVQHKILDEKEQTAHFQSPHFDNSGFEIPVDKDELHKINEQSVQQYTLDPELSGKHEAQSANKPKVELQIQSHAATAKEKFVLPHEDDSQVQVNLELRPELKEGKDGHITIEIKDPEELIPQVTTEVAQPEHSEEIAARAAQSILVDDEVSADAPPVLPVAHEDMVIALPVAHEVALDLDAVRNQARTFISDNHLDDSAREAINSVFGRYGDHLDQLLLTKLNEQLLSDNPDAAYNFFEFLSYIADPQKAKTELYPGITYAKFYNIITGQDKVTMEMMGQEIDLRETFVNFIPEYLKARETGISLAYIQSLKVALINTYKEIFTREVNKVNRDFSSLKFNIFPVGNDVMCDEGSFVIGICQMSPEFFDLYFRACQNMTRYSEFIANKFQFDISRFKFIEDFVVLNCNPKLEQYGVNARSTREISDMQDGWFAMKLIAACEGKEGINLREDSFKYDGEGSFPCSVSLREYLKNHKPDDIDSLLSNEEGFTLENILEKCPEFSALPTTYQIEVLEHWRGEQFTEEEVIKWIFNSPEIFEIAAAGSGKAGFSVAPYKTFLYRNTVEFLRNRLQYNPNREKYVIAYLRLLTHNESHITGLEFPKGVLGNVSYFELIDSLCILQKDVYKVDSVSINGLFSEDSSTIEQKILEFYLFSKPNGTVDETTIITKYLEGEFEAAKATRFTRARAEKTYAKRAVEYLVLNYNQLTPEIRRLISNFALDNIIDESQRKAIENLTTPLIRKEREAKLILRDPNTNYRNDQMGWLANLSSRRTKTLELQLKLKVNEYEILLQDSTETASQKRSRCLLTIEQLKGELVISREMDQKAIAILPSTIKEKEEAENKKLMNGFIIGTGVLGITGISVLAVLKTLGVIGAAAAAVAASANSQNNNDDNKNKGKTNAA